MIAEHHANWTDEQCWQAVLDRDPAAAFRYAVRSTGVYCRPSCPSRRPRRDQALFFADAPAARQAGFRPCRRCEPDEALDPSAALVDAACRVLDEATDHPISLTELGARVGSSPFHLQRTFKRVLGITPRQYADSRRVARLKQELRSGPSVTHAMYEAGYGSSSRVYERSGSHLGMAPNTYRRGAPGVTIEFACAQSRLGRVLVAATERGICFVCMGDSDDALQVALRAEYPAATLQPAGEETQRWVAAVVGYLDGRDVALDLPTDVRATAFQRRVWEALRAIPRGETRTYTDIARAIGAPNAVRAVGHACATNPVSLVVPCHRVLRTDGSLGGYRWGLHRKRALIEQERGTPGVP